MKEKNIILKLCINNLKNFKLKLWEKRNKSNTEAFVDKMYKPEGAKEIGAILMGEYIVNKDIMVHIYYIKEKGFIGYVYFHKRKKNKKFLSYTIIFDKSEEVFNKKIDEKVKAIKNMQNRGGEQNTKN